jgi:arylsulfatase A-like enzyme
MFVDVLVGKLMSKLKREGIYDEAVIVVTGDHGWRTSERPSPETPPISIPHVPLVIHAPGLDSDVSDVDYQHIDFGPTLTDILGLPPPNDTEGVSAFSTERPQRDKFFFDFQDDMYIYSDEDDSWHFSPQE